MDEVLAQVDRAIREGGLLRRGQAVLVAVSGGLDSRVLLEVLRRLARSRRWRLIVAHFDHQLRGRQSTADRRWVQRLARHLRLPCVAGQGDVRRRAREQGLSTEMAARTMRHEFLAHTARRLRIARIALGHQADDQVELFFLRLLRGTGPEGLGGMRPAAPSPVDARVRLIRPLLVLPRSQLLDWAHANRLRWREDESNRNVDVLRNRVRHRLLPLLERSFQPAVRRSVARLMELLRAESDLVVGMTTAWTSTHGARSIAWLESDQKPAHRLGFAKLPPAVQRRILAERLVQLKLAPSFELIETLRANTDRKILVGGGRRVWRKANGNLRMDAAQPARFKGDSVTLSLERRAGRKRFANGSLSWSKSRLSASGRWEIARGKDLEVFDAESLGGTIRLRHWQPGDRYQPIGLPHSVKLQNCFVNLRVGALERRSRVVAEDARGRIFWVEGLRISEVHKVGGATRDVIRWRWTTRRDQAS